MSPFYSSYYSCVPKEDLDFLQVLAWHVCPFTRILTKQNKNLRKKIECSSSWCHLAARVVEKTFPEQKLEVIDGLVYDLFLDEDKNFRLCSTVHSWLLTRNGTILDVAPVGIQTFSPLLVAKREGVKDQSWGYISDKYVQDLSVKGKVEALLRTQKFQQSFPVYLHVFESARREFFQMKAAA